MKEEWKPIKGYDIYEVSNLSRIRNVHKDRIKNTRIDKDSCERVKLYDKGVGKVMYVHTIVARTFIPGDHSNERLVHLNGDTTDNRLENLCYMDCSTATRKNIETGLRANNGGKPRKIKCLNNNITYPSIAACAKDLGISYATIYRNTGYINDKSNNKYIFEFVE